MSGSRATSSGKIKETSGSNKDEEPSALFLRIKFPKEFPMIYKTLQIPLSLTISEAMSFIREEQPSPTPLSASNKNFAFYLRQSDVWLHGGDHRRRLSDYADLLRQEGEIELAHLPSPSASASSTSSSSVVATASTISIVKNESECDSHNNKKRGKSGLWRFLRLWCFHRPAESLLWLTLMTFAFLSVSKWVAVELPVVWLLLLQWLLASVAALLYSTSSG
ncbi:hypothetical protein QOT17_001632 [Balamuthia mandrillaris]